MKNESKTTADNVVSTPKRKGRRRLFAILLGLLPFVILEIGLRVAGIGPTGEDLHSGFGNVAPLFELEESEGIYRTRLPKEQFFVSQEFAAEKPRDEFRIFCLGGSTVQGRPYQPETSFARWLAVELDAVDPSRNHKVVNCGGVSYASYRLRPVVHEVLKYEPDLIILATGHNEFLEDRTYASVKSRSGFRIWLEDAAGQLRTVMLLRKLTGGAARVEPGNDEEAEGSGGVEARLDDEAGYASYHRDDEWHEQVCNQYHDSVDEMLQMSTEAGVPLVAVRLGSNLRDCPPFKSEHKNDLSVEDERAWQVLFEEATLADEASPETALKIYRKARAIDDRHPLLHFRIARCLDRLEKYSEAAESYLAAKDGDICPLRMVDRMGNDLVKIASEKNIALVDANSLVLEDSPNAIPGYESYIDHVHPTIGTHQRISQAIFRELVKMELVNGEVLSDSDRRQAYARHIDSLGAAYYSNGRRRIGWLEGWARRQRLLDETLPVDSRGDVVTALRSLDLHDFGPASDLLASALKTNPSTASDFLDAAAGLFRQGRRKEARWVLDELKIESSDVFAEAIDHAFLVLAIDSGKPVQMEAALARHKGNWNAVLEKAQKSWVRCMPDISSHTDSAK